MSLVKTMLLGILLVPLSCQSTCNAQTPLRSSVYDAVYSDLTIISEDLRVRAESRASSAYTDAVAQLAVQNQKAKDLLAQKAEIEKPDYVIYMSWLNQVDVAHKEKLAQLGNERDEYLRLHRQRYETLRKDAEAIKALKDNEKARKDKCSRSGLSGIVRQVMGRTDGEATKLDIGPIGSLGSLTPALLP